MPIPGDAVSVLYDREGELAWLVDRYRKATGGASIEQLEELWTAPHRIQFRDDGWTIEHPIKERIEGSLWQCKLNWDGDDPGLRGVYDLSDDGLVVLPYGGEGCGA